jgi:hypothetical protein
MVKVFSARDPAEAHLVKALLEGHGIIAVVHDEAGSLGRYCHSSPSVWVVEETDGERAAHVIATEHGPPNPTHCQNCGYNLWGLPEPRCPECGKPFTRLDAGPSWVCPQCGEECEGQFAQCWNCGQDRPGAE